MTHNDKTNTAKFETVPVCSKCEILNSGLHHSILDKMKRSVYNTICWNPVDSETNLHMPRANADYIPHTEVFLDYFKKCGDFLKETRSKSARKKPDGQDRKCPMQNKPEHVVNKKRSTYSAKNTEPRVANVEPIDTSRDTSKKHEEVMWCKPEDNKKKLEKCGQGEGEKKSQTRTKHQEKPTKDIKSNHVLPDKKASKQSKVDGNGLVHNCGYKGKFKRCKQIYELSDQQCRNFKEKGYVKVNVKVKPNISVSDFDIVIRKDKIKSSHTRNTSRKDMGQ